MSPPTPTSPLSSIGSGRAIVLEPRPSRLLRAWWIGLHLLLLAVVARLDVGLFFELAGALLLAAHSLVRYPAAAPGLVCHGDGRWAVPSLALADLTLDGRTRFTTLWVRLSLAGAGGPVDIVLLVDQLDAESWRRLQAHLRRSPESSAATASGSTRGRTDLR